jgi:hypothetical protein
MTRPWKIVSVSLGTFLLNNRFRNITVIRVEWCKAHARANRWTEDVTLIKEEMGRCLITLEYKANQWDQRVEYNGPLSKGKSAWADDWSVLQSYVGPLMFGTDRFHGEGVRAYAKSQAAVFRGLATKFRDMWAGIRQKERDIEEGQDWSSVLRTKYLASEDYDSEEDLEAMDDINTYIDDDDDE